MPSPLRFVFAVHLHQPVGNFDSVFEQHLADVYRPFLEKVDERGFLPVVLHLSGPLLEWLERHDPGYLDQLARLAGDGRLELLCGGMYEPILASLPRQDRVEQVGWLREAIARRFGVNPTGLWLTERVWEPDLAADLVDAGVRQLVVAGGETSGACVQALGIAQLRIGAQIDPGVPWCHALSPAAPQGLHLTLKSGNVGGEDFFTRAFEVLRT